MLCFRSSSRTEAALASAQVVLDLQGIKTILVVYGSIVLCSDEHHNVAAKVVGRARRRIVARQNHRLTG